MVSNSTAACLKTQQKTEYPSTPRRKTQPPVVSRLLFIFFSCSFYLSSLVFFYPVPTLSAPKEKKEILYFQPFYALQIHLSSGLSFNFHLAVFINPLLDLLLPFWKIPSFFWLSASGRDFLAVLLDCTSLFSSSLSLFFLFPSYFNRP